MTPATWVIYGSVSHRYFARLYALRHKTGLPPGATAAEVKADNVKPLMGTYAKGGGNTH